MHKILYICATFSQLMNSRYRNFLLSALSFLALVSCSMVEHKPKVETFLVIDTSWEERLANEFRREASFYRNVDFRFNEAVTPEKQAEQINAAVSRGVDAIIVNPYAVDVVRPALDAAYDAGVSVVIVGQKTGSSKYTAYVGPDNVQLGRKYAEAVKEHLPKGGNVVLVDAFRDAPFYKERLSAFIHEISHRDDIRIVAEVEAGWDRLKAHLAMDSLRVALGDTKVDVIMAVNDDMAIGAREADGYDDAFIIGSDGAYDLGAAAVRDGKIDLTFTNPSCGDKAIKIAVDILGALPYEKDNIVSSKMLNRDNAALYIDKDGELTNYEQRIDSLNARIELYQERFNNAHWLLLILTVLMILLVTILIHNSILGRARKDLEKKIDEYDSLKKGYDRISENKEVSEHMNRSLEAENKLLLELVNTSCCCSAPAAEEFNDSVEEAVFMKKFRDTVEENIDNPALSIDMLAENLGISRAQLYRRVKADAGYTPNELIQAVRLDKAYSTLKNTDWTVAEVAYSVGFSSPSYFSKCYKDKFGVAPKDAKSSQKR